LLFVNAILSDMAALTAPRPLLGVVLLLFVSAAWGSAFPLMKDLILRMPVADLLAERYAIATVALVAVRPRCLRGLSDRTWLTGVLAGLLFGSGQTAQAVALQELPSAVSGFAVGSYVVITPLLGMVFLRARIGARVWFAAALALAALVVFTLLREAEGEEISLPALALTLMAAVMYAVHTLVLGTRRRDAYAVAVIQLGTIAVLTGVMALPGGITLPESAADWGLLLHLALIACALGFLARSFGQQHVRPVPAAVILAAQPVWVTAFAVVLYGDPLTWRVFLGGGLIAVAVLLVLPRRFDLESAPGGMVVPRTTHPHSERT
jgi:drug/metabolite transporter (DMT)-like permease